MIGSSSLFLVTRTCIKALKSLNFRQIGQLTTELAALGRLKINASTFPVAVDAILLKHADNKEMLSILDEF